MELEPLNDFVLAKLLHPASRKVGNIEIPDIAGKEERNICPARVIGLGPKVDLPLAVGDYIYVRRLNVQQFGLGALYRGDLVQLHADDVMGRLNNFDPQQEGFAEEKET